jgi:hypothetical protein
VTLQAAQASRIKETQMGKGDHRQRKEVKKPKKDKALKGKK